MNRLPETNGNVVTSWIPLESAWPGNPDCSTALWNYYGDIIAGYDPGYGVTYDAEVTCHPKAVTTWWLQERFGSNAETVVSLGPINCPKDYTTATSRVQDSSSTLIACCPSGYDYNNQIMSQGSTGQCTSKVAVGDVLSYATHESGIWSTKTSTVATGTLVVGVQINGWKFAEETEAPTRNTSSSILYPATQSASADVNPQNEPFGNSAKIGIGIGVSLGVTGLVALGAGLLMMYRARKAARFASTSSIEKDLSDGGKPMSSSQFSQSYTPDIPQTNPGIEIPHYPDQTWGGGAYSTEQAVYPTYGMTVPHGEMDGTSPPPDINERIQRRMELEGEFERNVKVLHFPP